MKNMKLSTFVVGIFYGHSIPNLMRSRFGRNKGKAIQLQAWTSPEGSRSLRLPDFKTIGT